MPRKHKHRKPVVEKACINCEHAQYIGEGDYVCDMCEYAVVLTDFTVPTDEYMICKGHQFKPNI